MTSCRAMLRSEQGKTSPSFLFAVLLIAAVVIAAVGWRYLRPNPFKQSEEVVRESRRVLNARVRDFEQELRDLMQKSGMSVADRLTEIGKEADAAKAEIDAYLDEARSDLAELDIPLNTHQNRIDRLTAKADEAKKMIDDRLAEKREQLTDG